MEELQPIVGQFEINGILYKVQLTAEFFSAGAVIWHAEEDGEVQKIHTENALKRLEEEGEGDGFDFTGRYKGILNIGEYRLIEFIIEPYYEVSENYQGDFKAYQEGKEASKNLLDELNIETKSDEEEGIFHRNANWASNHRLVTPEILDELEKIIDKANDWPQ